MNHRRLFLGCIVLLAILLAWRWDQRAVRLPPGVIASAPPVQENITASRFELDGFELTRRARFSLRARVLSSERYYVDAGARLAPVDLALAWGPMSDQQVMDRIDVSQGGRWYNMRWDTPPIPEDKIMLNSANMHMIPAEPWVEKKLRKLRTGQVVSLRGYLVDATRPDGWSWQTSMSRRDTGGGSCELVFIEFLETEL